MKKIILLFLLLIGIILIGAGCGKNSAQGFYESYCKTYINHFQDNFVEYLESGTEGAKAMGGYFETMEECIEENTGREQAMVDACEKYGGGDCNEVIKNTRDTVRKGMTMSGCKDLWGAAYCGAYNPDKAANAEISSEDLASLTQIYTKCMAEIDQLCSDLPQSVNW